MYKRVLKRILDIVFSVILLILFLPFGLILTPIIAIKMKGNPFFIQPRSGKNEKIFNIIKYRTMTNEKDEKGELLPNEERMTKFGNLLRTLSIDEIPELINVLKGDMSFVGPRPLLIDYLEIYNETQRKRHDVLPGITGLAQVCGRNSISWKKKFKYDVYYVENLNFKLDLMIIFKTIEKVLKKDGIYDKDGNITEKFNGRN